MEQLASLTTTLESLDNILREGLPSVTRRTQQTLVVELRKALAGLSPDSAVGQSLGNSVLN